VAGGRERRALADPQRRRPEIDTVGRDRSRIAYALRPCVAAYSTCADWAIVSR
jgi:hypothetical protein